MKKPALVAVLGGLGVVLVGCGGTAKRSLAVAVNRETAAAGSLTSDRFLSPKRLLVVTSGSSSCPAVPDKVVVLNPNTVRIHLTEGTWQRS